jgi:hypothetical protein
MKPKGTREYVKSKGEYVLLPVYVKRVAKIAAKKLIKNKNGKKKIRGGEPLSLQVIDINKNTVLDLCKIHHKNAELVLLFEENVEGYIELENNLVAIKIQVKNEDKSLDKEDKIIIKVKYKTDFELNLMSNYRVKGSPYEGTTYYKRDNNGNIEKIYSEEIKCETEGRAVYYYHIFTLKIGETIYSEKNICNLRVEDIQQRIEFDSDGKFRPQIPMYNHNTSLSLEELIFDTTFDTTKFNINCVENILLDYTIYQNLRKLYIYLNNEYREVEVSRELYIKNLNALKKYRTKNNNSTYPVTHTRITSFTNPFKYSRGVNADLVMRTHSSTNSNAVDVNPDDLSININEAYLESRKKNSIFPNLKKSVSRIFTGRNTGRRIDTQVPSLFNRKDGGTRKSSPLKKNKGKKIINKHMFPNI